MWLDHSSSQEITSSQYRRLKLWGTKWGHGKTCRGVESEDVVSAGAAGCSLCWGTVEVQPFTTPHPIYDICTPHPSCIYVNWSHSVIQQLFSVICCSTLNMKSVAALTCLSSCKSPVDVCDRDDNGLPNLISLSLSWGLDRNASGEVAGEDMQV